MVSEPARVTLGRIQHMIKYLIMSYVFAALIGFATECNAQLLSSANTGERIGISSRESTENDPLSVSTTSTFSNNENTYNGHGHSVGRIRQEIELYFASGGTSEISPFLAALIHEKRSQAIHENPELLKHNSSHLSDASIMEQIYISN